MAHVGSYLWRLRQAIGHDLALVPGGMVALRHPDGQVFCFLLERWRGDPEPDGEESTAIRFAPLTAPPEPLHTPGAHALWLLAAFLPSAGSR